MTTDAIRPLAAADAPDLARIFFCAVHEGTRHRYNAEQRRAWGGETLDLARWRARTAQLTGFVALEAAEPVGFMTIDAAGYIELAYVLPSQVGRGRGSALLAHCEHWAATQRARRLTTEASLVAQPFFAHRGWQVETPETVIRQGVALDRFRMFKLLA